MYQHILLAVALQRWEEFSQHALAARELAVTLAKGCGAKLSVLSVYDYNDFEMPSMPTEMAAHYRGDRIRQIDAVMEARHDYIRRTDAMMETKMKAFLAGMQTMGLSINSMLKEGDPRHLIIATTEALGVDLLVIGAHSKRSVFDVVLGGTAAYVSRHAPCPVIMVKPGEKHPSAASRGDHA